MWCCRARYFARYVSVSDCASVTDDDVDIAAVVSPDDDAADQAERSQATQSSKAASAARPAERRQACKAASAAEPRHISISQAEAPSEDIRGSAVSEAVRPLKEQPLFPDATRCDRCGMMNAIADVSLCVNCFYETDKSFKCDLCGYHKKEVGGLYHRSGSKLCNECFDYSHNADRRDSMRAVEREIALHREQIAWHREQMAKTDEARPTAMFAAAIHYFEKHLEHFERKLEALKREAEQILVNLAPTKLSDPHINVSRPPPNIEEPSTWLTFTLPGSSQRR